MALRYSFILLVALISAITYAISVDDLAKCIMSEASVCNKSEQIAIGFACQRNSIHASNQKPTPTIVQLAKDILNHRISDPTEGANHWYSPRGMPTINEKKKCGRPIGNGNMDCRGGLENVCGRQSYKPSWTTTARRINIPNDLCKMQSMTTRLKPSTLDRSLQKTKGDANLSTFTLLFSEMVQYSQNRVDNIHDLQNKLSDLGKHVGSRVLDLYFLRIGKDKREVRLTPMLVFVQKIFWKFLFNREADFLEQHAQEANIYYLIERECLVNKFISVPKDKGTLNCASFVAGIVESVLCSSGFTCKVLAHQGPRGTIYVITFAKSVVERENRLDSK